MRRGSSTRRYLHIHGDENTAREVLIQHMRRHAGVAFLVKSTTRNVPVEGAMVDPNRIFSRVGAEKTLRSLNPGLGEKRIEEILLFLDQNREKLVSTLLPPDKGLLAVLHNNARGYSVKDEAPISDRVSLQEPSRPHEFFLCTQEADFRQLADGPYNVVLQNEKPQEDDGSLSRLAARRGVRYVNLEAALGESQRQREMLAFLEKLPA